MGKYAPKNTDSRNDTGKKSFYSSEKNKGKNNIGIPALILIILLIAFGIYYWQGQQQPILGGIHIHADFKVYLNDAAYNFSQAKYMSEENSTHKLSPFIHLHDLNGGVIHQHISNINLGYLFKSLNMTFNSTCFGLDNGTNYCNNGNNTIKMYVKHNGSTWEQSNDFGTYQFQDLDKILISYGFDNSSQINNQEGSVTDLSCMYSNKCPERGSLDINESGCAVGGNDSGCSAG